MNNITEIMQQKNQNNISDEELEIINNIFEEEGLKYNINYIKEQIYNKGDIIINKGDRNLYFYIIIYGYIIIYIKVQVIYS